MVTSNSGESRSRSTRYNGEGKERGRNYQNGEKKEYKPYNKGPRDNDRRDGKSSNGNERRDNDRRDNDRRDNDRRYSKGSDDFRGSRDNNSRDNNRRDGRSSNNNDRGPRNSFRSNDSRPGNKFGGNKPPYKKNYGDRNYGNPYDKDSDDDSKPQRRQAPAKDNKVKEQQPDKIEIINRIEKEKKAMQKKQAERKNSKPVKQMARPKRTNNIDWTKEYENGSYDDDDLDIYL